MDLQKKNLLKSQDKTKDNKPVIKDNMSLGYFLKKTEKLTAALYRITDAMDNKDPLKWRLRGLSIELLTSMMSLIGNTLPIGPNVFETIHTHLYKLITLLEVTYMGSYVSHMNITILRDEYSSLEDLLIKHKEEHIPQLSLEVSEDVAIDEKFGNHITSDNFDNASIPPAYDKRKDLPGSVKKSYKGHSEPLSRTKKTITISKGHRSPHKDGTLERKNVITDFIRRNGEVSIKDIFSIPVLSQNVSEKTIQRDLVQLVVAGAIRKKGERRWSKYFI